MKSASTAAVIGNLMLDARGDAWGTYRVPTVSYPLLPIAAKQQLHARLAAFAHGVRSDFTFWRVTRATTDDGASRAVECYVAIRIDAATRSGLATRILRSTRRVPGRVSVAGGVLSRVDERERELRAHARETLDARPATSQELVWLLARTRTLGVAEPDVDVLDHRPALHVLDTDTIVVEPAQAHRVPLPDAAIAEAPDQLVISTPLGALHHSVLTIGALPDGMEFPGGAEAASTPVERCDTPCDVIVHARWISNATALSRAGRSLLEADNSTAEQATTGRVADSRLHDQLDTAVQYKRYLESDEAPPVLAATISLVLAASSAAQLTRACTDLRSALAPIHAHRPWYVQRSLWESAQQPRRAAHGATPQLLTIEQFAALMPIATETVGSATGPRIGHLRRSGRPVHLDLGEAPRESRPPSILCVGTLGSGKTMTSQLLALQALEQGSLVVDVDPKPDHTLDQLPKLQGRSRVIDLADLDQHAGRLDPLAIADQSLRDEVAASFYADLLSATPRQRALLRTALTELARQGMSTSGELIRIIRRLPHPDAADTAEQLEAWSRSGLARLALGERRSTDAEPAVDLTSIRCASLTLPDASAPRSDYTEVERVSCAIMRLIATHALALALRDRSRHKLVMIDEAWLLLASSDGRTLIDRLNRTGRSENATLLLATQQLADAARTAPLIGTHLVFGLETRDEASRAAQLLGIDDTDETAQMLQSQRTGQAVMRDTRGRLAQIQIDVPAELLTQLSTTPPTSEATT